MTQQHAATLRVAGFGYDRAIHIANGWWAVNGGSSAQDSPSSLQ